jgi:hypothetical protein
MRCGAFYRHNGSGLYDQSAGHHESLRLRHQLQGAWTGVLVQHQSEGPDQGTRVTTLWSKRVVIRSGTPSSSPPRAPARRSEAAGITPCCQPLSGVPWPLRLLVAERPGGAPDPCASSSIWSIPSRRGTSHGDIETPTRFGREDKRRGQERRRRVPEQYRQTDSATRTIPRADLVSLQTGQRAESTTW